MGYRRRTAAVSGVPRYIDSQQAEDIQDIAGHLRGSIPTADVDALVPYWAVCPQLRQILFQDNRRMPFGAGSHERTIGVGTRKRPQSLPIQATADALDYLRKGVS